MSEEDEAISLCASCPCPCRFPKDLCVSPEVRVTFSGVVDDGKTLAGYSDENAFEMGFVGAGASAAPVRVMHEVSEDRWADVAPWTSLEHERRYLLLTGRRYRVVEDADSDNAIFEIRPPKFREVASVCSRKPSSYAIHLHGMTLDA